MQYIRHILSPVGGLTISSDGISLTGLWMDGQKYFGSTLEKNTFEKELPVFAQAEQWLDDYFQGKNPQLTIPLMPSGSPFRQSVWKLLTQIPYGTVTTYGALARILEQQTGKRISAQAVGGAVGHNPIGIFIPCHRVVGASGSLTGYAGGIAKKIQLLQLENVSLDHFFIPKNGTAISYTEKKKG